MVASQLAVPSAAQLHYQDMEVGAFFQYNIGEYGELHSNYACSDGVEPVSSFVPSGVIDTDAWVSAIKLFGAQYALLTTQAGCGFLLWPSNSSLASGQRYNYTVREAAYEGGDLVEAFVKSCRKQAVRPGLYYIVNNNVFCGVKGGVVVGGQGACGNHPRA